MEKASTQRLDAATLQQRLEQLVFMVLSVRRSVEAPACELAQFERAQQERFLKSVEFISQQTVELAYNFACFGVRGLRLLRLAEWEPWVHYLLEQYNQSGVLPVIAAMQKVDQYLQQTRNALQLVRFEEVIGILDPFIRGLNGRGLHVAVAEQSYTDTQTLYLPPTIQRYNSHAQNYRLYKSIAVHLWAQTWYGTWHQDVSQVLVKFPQHDRALTIFYRLETLRLDACIERDLPGVARELSALRASVGSTVLPPAWQAAQAVLEQQSASVQDSYDLLASLLDENPPPAVCYQGVLLPDITQQHIVRRKQQDKKNLQRALDSLRREYIAQKTDEEIALVSNPFILLRSSSNSCQYNEFQLTLLDDPSQPIVELQHVLDSIAQDFGYIPDEYLVPAGHGGYAAGDDSTSIANVAGNSDTGDSCYDEWDYMRKQYRRNWCTLCEREVHPIVDNFVQHTQEKYRGLLKQLYRTFEALRGEERVLKKQPFGDDVDIDATVEAYSDMRVGLEPSENLFVRRKRVDRNIAVLFLVDMSGSTKGWINDIQRESLVLLCESLEILGDRYGIYGFSGLTHKRCDLYCIKQLDEPYNEQVRARISGIRPRDYTRMGVFIRHMTHLFQDIDARTKLLITLSDGRPDDQDGYRGLYGIEDTRQALIEARFQGIHPYCITIDDEAMEYLPHMYGPVSFTVISEVHKLPYKVSDIYRRITM